MAQGHTLQERATHARPGNIIFYTVCLTFSTFFVYLLTIVCQRICDVQNRNVHGKIFGGYIMKKAFEIANVAAVSALLGTSYHLVKLSPRISLMHVLTKIVPFYLLLQVCFFGEQYPHFVFIDDIQFVRVRPLLHELLLRFSALYFLLRRFTYLNGNTNSPSLFLFFPAHECGFFGGIHLHCGLLPAGSHCRAGE